MKEESLPGAPVLDTSLCVDASPSWSGFNYQGKVALYVVISKINELRSQGQENLIGSYFLELEWMEDFSILRQDKDETPIYESVHQVKARKDDALSEYSDALLALLLKTHRNAIPKAWLHTSEELRTKGEWNTQVESILCNRKPIENSITLLETILFDEKEYRSFFKNSHITKYNSITSHLNKFTHNKKNWKKDPDIKNLLRLRLQEQQSNLQELAHVQVNQTAHRISRYAYPSATGNDAPQHYCSISYIDNLIEHEISSFIQKVPDYSWASTDNGIVASITGSLLLMLDHHISQRHLNYSTNTKKVCLIPFSEIENIINDLKTTPLHQCKQYWLVLAKKALMRYFMQFCDECREQNSTDSCIGCRVYAVQTNIDQMDFDTLEHFFKITNVRNASDINEENYQLHIREDGFNEPFFIGLQRIMGPYRLGSYVTFENSEKLHYLLTTLCRKSSIDSEARVCRSIIENNVAYDFPYDFDALITKDFECDNISKQVGSWKENNDPNNIYYPGNLAMITLEASIKEFELIQPISLKS